MKQPLKVNILAAEQQWDDCSSSAEKNLIMSISDHLMMVSYTMTSNGKFRMLFNEGCCFIMRKKISAFTSPYYLLILLFILHIFNMLIGFFLSANC